MRQVAAQSHRAVRALAMGLMALILAGQLSVVILRYVFGIGFIELQDAVAYSFAALVVLGLPVALAQDAHVRVDVWRAHQSPRGRALFDRIGILTLLIPVFALTIWWVWPDITYSWSIREASVETGGLPGLYLVKSTLPLACLLMILQGVAQLIDPPGARTDD